MMSGISSDVTTDGFANLGNKGLRNCGWIVNNLESSAQKTRVNNDWKTHPLFRERQDSLTSSKQEGSRAGHFDHFTVLTGCDFWTGRKLSE